MHIDRTGTFEPEIRIKRMRQKIPDNWRRRSLQFVLHERRSLPVGRMIVREMCDSEVVISIKLDFNLKLKLRLRSYFAGGDV